MITAEVTLLLTAAYLEHELIREWFPGPGGSLVDASGYKFSDKDTKPGKIKLKKNVKTGKTKKGDGTIIPYHLL